MAFTKSFPVQKTEGSYTSWKEISLDHDEEKHAEEKARDDHIRQFQECLDDAKEILLKTGMKQFDPNIIAVANTLFEKRASHTSYYKEDAARKKFNALK